MTDILKRIKLAAKVFNFTRAGIELLKDCAVEITRLRAENEKLREALSDAAGELQHAYIMGFTERYRDAAIAARRAVEAIRETDAP